MRELTTDEFGILLSLFAVLLLAFSADFHFSRKTITRHRVQAIVFVSINLLGELATVVAMMLTWVALWSSSAWEQINDLLVLVPGSIAILCAVTLTLESVYMRVASIANGVRIVPLAASDDRDDADQDS